MTTPPPLLGAYTPPPVKPGDEVHCSYRRAKCRGTSWTDAPIPWPRVNQIGIQGGSGLLVNAELVRAIRRESAAALMYWFGVGTKAAWNWRKRFVPGEGHYRTAGDVATQRRASEAGAAVTRGVPLSDAECDARTERAKRLGLKPVGRWTGHEWTDEQRALLGTMPDAELASLTGRTEGAVRAMRAKAKIRAFRDRRRRSADGPVAG